MQDKKEIEITKHESGLSPPEYLLKPTTEQQDEEEQPSFDYISRMIKEADQSKQRR